MYLLDNLLEDLVINVGKELVELLEGYPVLVLLKEPNDVGLRSSLDKVLIRPRLRIINLHVRLGFNLPHHVHLLEFPHEDLIVAMFILVHNTQEVVAIRLVIEHRAVVHVVFKDGDASVLPVVNLPE